jgi:adenylate cyclase
MPGTLSLEELSARTGVSTERIEWLTAIGLIVPVEPGRFVPGDGFRTRMIDAVLQAGVSPEHVELAVRQHRLDLSHVDNYILVDAQEQSNRSFDEFVREAGDRGTTLPSLYPILGLPEPDPGAHLPVVEEELLRELLQTWELARDDRVLARAARIVAEAVRRSAGGWSDLFDEQISGPARARMLSGELDTFPRDAMEASIRMHRLLPRLTTWLTDRAFEQLIVAGIVERFEEFLGSRGLAEPRAPGPPPAVAFVDISGFTRLTERLGDEAAVRASGVLQERAESIAAAGDGRLVKLLGDGALLLFRDPAGAASAVVDIVRRLTEEEGLPAHAGIDAGPVIQRDMDVFGHTVNVASRLADRASPGEVLASEAVKELVDDGFRFDEVERAALKGIGEPVTLYRVQVGREG